MKGRAMKSVKAEMVDEALRLLRVYHDKKVKDMAKELGISASFLSEIEKGKKQPTLKLLKKFSEVFNITISAVLRFSENLRNNYFDTKNKIQKIILLAVLEANKEVKK